VHVKARSIAPLGERKGLLRAGFIYGSPSFRANDTSPGVDRQRSFSSQRVTFTCKREVIQDSPRWGGTSGASNRKPISRIPAFPTHPSCRLLVPCFHPVCE
jgi:hypothetical protein